MNAPVREIRVAVGVVVRDGRVLIARRPDHVHQGGLLEFPGGKVEPGETTPQALVRELAEETGLTVAESSLSPLICIRHDYGDKRVLLDVWRTEQASGEARGLEGQPLFWLAPEALEDAQFPEANRPIIRALRLPPQLAITGDAGELALALQRLEAGLPVLAKAAPLVLLRAPALAPLDYQAFANRAIPLCQARGRSALVHGHPDRFEQVPGAAGLHLPWREAARLSARPVPASAWLGVSCHDAEQLRHAASLGADYATLGPVLPTATHPGEPGIGWDVFADLVAKATLPVYALGGVGPAMTGQAIERGGQGIAGIGFWWPRR